MALRFGMPYNAFHPDEWMLDARFGMAYISWAIHARSPAQTIALREAARQAVMASERSRRKACYRLIAHV